MTAKEKLFDLVNAPAPITNFFDSFNMTSLHTAFALYGIVTGVVVMQLWTMGTVKIEGDCWITVQVRRFALLVMALAMVWALVYSDLHGYQAWPPFVMLELGIDILFTGAIVVAFRRECAERRFRRTQWRPSAKV